MKVIHYIASIDKAGGGTTEYMRLLSTALQQNCEFKIATGRSQDPIAIDGVAITYFDSSVLKWFSILKEFKVFLKLEQPDIVHINGIWSPLNWGFQKVAQELNIKVILSPHGMLEPWILANNPWKKKIAFFLYQKKAIDKADYLHATAAMEALNIKALGYTNPMTIIPNGVDLADVKAVKKNYGTRKMVFLSRIHPKKGIELLLEAWENTDTQDWILEIAGNGDADYIAQLHTAIQKIGNVQLVGAKYGEDKWDFLRSADVMVLPTHSENFGIVVAEALAVGVPVLTTTGTPWEDLVNTNSGWWIALSVANLEKVVADIVALPLSTLEQMGNNGKQLVAGKYEMNAVGEKMMELYKNTLK